MTEALLEYREDLDTSKCDRPGCTCAEGPLWIHSQCHPQTPTWCKYLRGGTMVVICAECESEVARFAVASKQIGPPPSEQ